MEMEETRKKPQLLRSPGGGDGGGMGDSLQGVGAYQIAKDARQALKGIKDKMKLPPIVGGKAIQVSAKQ